MDRQFTITRDAGPDDRSRGPGQEQRQARGQTEGNSRMGDSRAGHKSVQISGGNKDKFELINTEDDYMDNHMDASQRKV